MNTNSKDTTATIRSYVLRQGRATTAQQRAWRELAPRYIVPQPLPEGGWQQLFGNPAPLVVEIGSGYGEATAAMAAADPTRNYIAIEVHTPGIGALMNHIAEASIGNVRILHGDALRLIPSQFADSSIAAFNIFFPDPWPKRRHNKRRLIRPAVVQLLTEKLTPGGGIHFATDWHPYATAAAEVFAAHPTLTQASPPPRAPTGYEARAAKANREIKELYYRKTPSPA